MSSSPHAALRNGTEIYIDKKSDRDFDYYVRKFNKKVQKSRLLIELSNKRFHLRPAVKRKRKEQEAFIRKQKDLKKTEMERLKRRKYNKEDEEN
jgi:ribosomal protein S21